LDNPQPQSAPKPLVRLINASIQINQRTLVDAVTLTVSQGEIVTLIGPNGAGKTTLSKAILGLMPLSAGELWRDPELRIGYMPQKINLDFSIPLTVKRFLLNGRNAKPQQVPSVLADVNASHLIDQPIQGLSGGEMQRVLLARALLQEPQLLVLDEPVQGVDITGQTELYNLIQQIRDRYQCGIVMVSHDLHLVMSATDRVICMNKHICCSGHPENVSTDPAFLELFNVPQQDGLAIYTHHHDHSHDDAGHVCNHGEHGEKGEQHD